MDEIYFGKIYKNWANPSAGDTQINAIDDHNIVVGNLITRVTLRNLLMEEHSYDGEVVITIFHLFELQFWLRDYKDIDIKDKTKLVEVTDPIEIEFTDGSTKTFKRNPQGSRKTASENGGY